MIYKPHRHQKGHLQVTYRSLLYHRKPSWSSSQESGRMLGQKAFVLVLRESSQNRWCFCHGNIIFFGSSPWVFPAIAVVRLSWGVAFNHRKTMGKPYENPIKLPEISWKYHGIMGISWDIWWGFFTGYPMVLLGVSINWWVPQNRWFISWQHPICKCLIWGCS